MYSDTLVTSDTHHVFVLSGVLNHDVTIVQGSELDDVLTSCCSWRIEEARGIWMLNSAITPSSPINFCHFSSVLCEIKALLVVLLVLMVQFLLSQASLSLHDLNYLNQHQQVSHTAHWLC